MSEMKIPRLKKGQGIKGPDFYNCSNTGLAPALIFSKVAGRYLVGPELFVTEFQYTRQIALQPRKRKFRFERNRIVYAYKTRTSAVKLFRALVAAVNENNQRIAAKHRADLVAANNGDMAAALRLGDY